MFWPKLDVEPSALGFLMRQPFAHRGLHDGRRILENSLAAFDAAIAGGYGIELDVRGTQDGDVVVFHDATLERMTDERGEVARLSAAHLGRVRLKGSEETLKTLYEVLHHVGGRVPILIEVKSTRNEHLPACFAVRRALEGYRGEAAVMSFHPGVPAWYAENAPKFVRGLVMTESDEPGMSAYGLRRWLRRQVLVWRAKPHFIAYDVRRLPSPFIATARQRGYRVLAWTVRGTAAHTLAEACADQAIFEGDLPRRATG